MKTDIDIKDDVYMLVSKSALAGKITGVVSKTLRPANSRKEDVVISILANNNVRPQSAYVNVNVYVPDLAAKYDVDDQTVKLKRPPRLTPPPPPSAPTLRPPTAGGDIKATVNDTLCIANDAALAKIEQ